MRSSSDAMRAIRANPLRSGLVGLAVLGTAVPLGMERVVSHADRVDPTHERTVHYSPGIDLDDAAVSEAWRESVREQTIERQMDRYAEYGVTRDVAEQIYDAAVDFDIDPAVAFGLVRAESSFRNSSTSVVGAVGLTQLMPRTAAWMVPGTSVRDLRNPETNLAIGFKYLRYLMDKYDQDENLALLAYNRGPGTVDRALRRGASPDNGYAAFVRGEEGHGHTLFTAR